MTSKQKEFFELMGKLAAMEQAGIKGDRGYKVENPSISEQGVENILPALSLGGSTNSGVNELYHSTLPK